MEQIIDFFTNIFDTSKWPPRWYCGYWSDFHGWLYILSDIVIWLAYSTIPLILIRFIVRKKGVPLPRVFLLFGLFILFCGFSHLIDAVIFWEPIYKFSALVKFVTAVVSLFTVLALFKYFDEAVGLKTSSEFAFELNFRKQAIKELKRSNLELSSFAYAASHDLKSPLITINSYLEYLAKKYEGKQLDEKAMTMIETTIESSRRMQTLVEDLLEFSQHGQKQDLESVDLNEIVEEVELELLNKYPDRNIQIKYSKLPVIELDRGEMKRVIQNLLDNSVKYSKADSDIKIQIKSSKKEDFWEFQVIDNGIGIDPRYSERVFQIFQRLHRNDEIKGSGIGLSTVYKIVESYGGKTWFESDGKNGTTFFFQVPVEIKLTRDYENESK